MDILRKTEAVELRRAIASYDRQADRWSFTIPRLERSPNRTLWKSWHVKARIAQHWRALLVAAILEGRILTPEARAIVRNFLAGRLPPGPRTTPARRVRIERWCAREQDKIRDVDNLMFSAKHILDALVRVGLLRDDGPAWCEREMPAQYVCASGQPYTVIVLEPITRKDPV